MEIKLDIDYEKFNRGFMDLQKASNIAAKNTLNIIAAITRKNFAKEVENNFILRNNWTVRNIRYEKTESENISTMVTRAGATDKASYLKTHENAERRISKRGSHLAIPQPEARGGSRRRIVSRSHYLRLIKNRTVRGKYKKRFKSRKAQTVARGYVAYNKKFYLKYDDNIYMVTSFSKRGNNIRFRKKHLYNVSQKTAHIKRTESLKPALKQPVADAQNIYNSQMRKLLKQRNII